MAQIYTVPFNESTSAPGPYYGLGDIVRYGWHNEICEVTGVRRIRGTRKLATLTVIDNPTPEETAKADQWQARWLGGLL